MVWLVGSANSAKDCGATGNSARPVYRLVVLLFVTAPLARAQACPPAVALTGDEALVSAIRDLLDARGIAAPTTQCPAVRARVERRGAQLVVGGDGPDGAPIERSVGEPATAASVIESWARSDVAAPLLAIRAVPVIAADAELAAPAPPPAARGIQLFAAVETTIGSDGTRWEGMQLGACIMLGPICVATRLRGGKVVSQPERWAAFARHGAEVYLGIDVPIALGHARLTPGFAAGYGGMFTRRKTDDRDVGVEIHGPRAEIHAVLSIPLTARVALDVTAAGAMTQATEVENRGPEAPDPAVVFPDEPRGLLRFAVGLRYGAL